MKKMDTEIQMSYISLVDRCQSNGEKENTTQLRQTTCMSLKKQKFVS